MKISPVIIVKDASRTIAKTLNSLKQFEEVIVYDTGSSDNTMDIAGNYANVRLCKGSFVGFGESKNKAASLAKNDWILSIDADEVVSPKLMKSIKELCLEDSAVYRWRRYNYYRNKLIKYSGWGNEYVTRLYDKTKVVFNEKLVHEHIEFGDAQLYTLDGELRHFSYHSISDFVRKRDLYSELFAVENKGKRKSSPFMAFLRGTFDFLNTFLIRRGILDGYRGLLIAVSNSNVSFYKYLKLYEANIRNEKKISLVITTYNWKEALLLTLKSALNQSIPPDEIIIADDGSGEDTKKVIEEFAKTSFIPIIHSWQEDKGFRAAKSRNLAISKANCEYIIFVDGDLVLHKKFIYDHIRASKAGYYVQGSRVLLNDELTKDFIQGKISRLPSIFSKKYRNKLNSVYFPFFLRFYIRKTYKSHDGVRSCNFSFYKEDLLKINGFNEEFVGWGREDSELVERLYNSGLYRRNLKFAGIQYHLFHKISKSSTLNNTLLSKAISENLVWCKTGLDQYLKNQILK